jgi:hypothetical protein
MSTMPPQEPQPPAQYERYTVEEQLRNSVRDVAGSWFAISLIGIIVSFFVKGALYYTPYAWAIVSIWLWRSHSVAAARALLGIAIAQFALALYGKWVEPTYSLGPLWSGILLFAAIHAWRQAKALENYLKAGGPVATPAPESTP